MLNDGAGDCKLVQGLLARVGGLGDEILKDRVYNGSIPRRGPGMFIASHRLECGIAGLEIDMLATTPKTSLFGKRKTYVVCHVCKTWDWYGL